MLTRPIHNISQELCENEARYHRTLIEDGNLIVPKNCENFTIEVSVSAKDEQWTLEKPLPRNQDWNPKMRQITQVRLSMKNTPKDTFSNDFILELQGQCPNVIIFCIFFFQDTNSASLFFFTEIALRAFCLVRNHSIILEGVFCWSSPGAFPRLNMTQSHLQSCEVY